MKNVTLSIIFILLCFPLLSQYIPAIGYNQVQGNDGIEYLRVISEANAVSNGNGVVKIVLPGDIVGAADLVLPSAYNASEVRIQTFYGTMAWAKRTIFAKTFDDGSWNKGSDLIQTLDDHYVIAGQTRITGSADVLLMKLDPLGDLLWSKAIGGESWDEAFSIVHTSDGGQTIVGQGFVGWVIIVKSNSSGNIEWGKRMGAVSIHSTTFVETSDGGYAILCSPSNSTQSSTLIKLTSVGNIEWAKDVGSGFGENIIQTSEGGFAVSIDDQLVKLNSSGNLEWAREIEYTISDIIETNDSGYVLTGRTTINDMVGVFLLKLDSNGNHVRTKIVGDDNEMNHYNANSIIETQGNDLVLTGNITHPHYSEEDYMIVVIRTDSSGNPYWIREMSENVNESRQATGTSIIETNDGNFAVSGLYRQSSEMNVFFTKISEDGFACFGTDITPVSLDVTPSITTATRIITDFTTTAFDIYPTVTDITMTEIDLCE